MHVNIPQNTEHDYDMPGPWWWGFNPKEDGTAAAPMIRCDAGHKAFLTRHNVSAQGVVTPSIVCPAEGCKWHVMGTLVGWPYGDRKGER